MKPLSELLQSYYLDWVNNYITTEKFAEHNNLSRDEASTIIDMGREHHEKNVS